MSLYIKSILQRQFARSHDASLLELIEAMNNVHHSKTNNYMKNKMDLITAKGEAKKLSQKQKDKKVYVIVDAEGECGLSFNTDVPNCTPLHCYQNGSEVALDVKQKPEPEKSNNKTMATTKTKATKKVAAKKTESTARPSNLIGKATTLFYTQAQWDKIHAAVKKDGTTIRDAATAALAKKYGV